MGKGIYREKKVFLIDSDDEEIRKLNDIFNKRDYTVTLLRTAEDALKVIDGLKDSYLPDLIIVRAVLPEMTGGQFVRRIRLNHRMCRTPILMLTDHEGSDYERDALESGADVYISRDVHSDLLDLRIQALLQSEIEWVSDGSSIILRRPRVVLAQPSSDPVLWTFWNDPSFNMNDLKNMHDDGPSLGELLWREGVKVASAERSKDFIEGVYLTGSASPDCLVMTELGINRYEDINFCRLIEKKRRYIRRSGHVPFRVLGIVSQELFLSPDCGRYIEAGIDDIVPVTMTPHALALRIRVHAHRCMTEEVWRTRQKEQEEQKRILQNAQNKAAMAEALASANKELAQSNKMLVETQEKLVQSAKMASLGELIAGIAHEINNPLAFTMAHLSTVNSSLVKLKKGLQKDNIFPDSVLLKLINKAQERCSPMKIGLNRIQDIVMRLRRFSYMEDEDFKRIDIEDALTTVLALLNHKMNTGITVIKDLKAPRFLKCQTALVNQAIMNLLSNSADAFTDQLDKKIMIKSHILNCDENNQKGDYIISVLDNGIGISENLKGRIFDPFFTTKEIGEGTGLGLSLVHATVRAHGGYIDVLKGLEGKGVCFSIYLPVKKVNEQWCVLIDEKESKG